MGSSTSGRLHSLTGLRWLAALGVFCVHATTMPYLFPIGQPISPHLGQALYALGEGGVSFFFVLSGFVLTWTARETDTVTAFLRRRFFKIYPTHLVTSLVAIGIMLATGITIELHHVPQELLLVQNWSGDSIAPVGVNGVSWSLGVEVVCYACFPLMLPLVRRVRPERLIAAVAVVVALVLLVPLVAGFLPFGAPIPGMPSLSSHQVWFVRYFPLPRMLEFLLGMLLARALAQGRLPRIPVPAAGIAVIAGLVIAGFAQTSLWSIVAVLLVPVGLMVTAAAQRDTAGGRWFATHPVLVWLGDVSFAFYLIHRIVLEAVDLAYPPDFVWTTFSAALMILISLAVSIGVAAALHHGVENPIYRRFAASRRRRPAPTEQAPTEPPARVGSPV